VTLEQGSALPTGAEPEPAPPAKPMCATAQMGVCPDDQSSEAHRDVPLGQLFLTAKRTSTTCIPTPDVCMVSVLLIEPDTARAALLDAALVECPSGPCRVQQVATLSSGCAYLATSVVDVVLFNRALSGGAGDAPDRAKRAAPGALILPLDETRFEDDDRLHAIFCYVAERTSTESILRIAEEALFEDKERGQVTLDSIGDAILVTDMQGHVTYLNRAAETMTGWAGNEASGQPCPRFSTSLMASPARSP